MSDWEDLALKLQQTGTEQVENWHKFGDVFLPGATWLRVKEGKTDIFQTLELLESIRREYIKQSNLITELQRDNSNLKEQLVALASDFDLGKRIVALVRKEIKK